jgi:hypothetical protein
MTEAEWLISKNAWAMLSRYTKKSQRQNRLVLLACCRMDEGEIANQELISLALDAAERHADGLLAASTLRKYKHRVARFRNALQTSERITPELYAANLVVLSVTPFGSAGNQPVPDNILFEIRNGHFSPRLETYLPFIFRDIFGNPYRTITVDPSWLTSTVVALATGIYQDRAFDRMPILADALQDAGCENVDILNHCRGEGVHVRGCWVVDSILGKK